MSRKTYYARKCDVTGKGMNEGYVFEDAFDVTYVKYKKDLISALRTYEEYDEITDNNELLQVAHDDGIYYWTEWYIEEDCEEVVYDFDGNEYDVNEIFEF